MRHERTLVDPQRAGKHFWQAWAEEQQRLRDRSDQLAVEAFNPCPPPGRYIVELPKCDDADLEGSDPIPLLNFELWAEAHHW